MEYLETAIRWHMSTLLPPCWYFISLSPLFPFPDALRKTKQYLSAADHKKIWQLTCKKRIQPSSLVFCLRNVPTAEDTVSLKNAYLIVGAKSCYAGKYEKKAIHRSMIAAATHEYINAFHIQRNPDHCIAGCFFLRIFFWILLNSVW